jgi:hypothetical protein
MSSMRVPAAVLVTAAVACAGTGSPAGWQVIEEYDAATGANNSFADLAVADGADSARIGLTCRDGTMRILLYQKRAEDREWLLPFNFLMGFTDDDAPGRYTKPDLATTDFQEAILAGLESGAHDMLVIRTQMGLVADDLAQFMVPLDGARSAMRRLHDCAPRGQ